MNELKKRLYKQCLEYVGQRILTAEDAIRSAKESSESDTKSSAGDKYETTREMMQQEISRNEHQLIEAKKLLHALRTVNTAKSYTTAVPGALVVTDHGTFFVSISAGQIELEGKKYFTVAASSPIGIRMKGLSQGHTFHFNQKDFKILQIF